MKKILCACMLVLCMGLFSGCSGKTDADVSTVFIEKKGTIVSVDVEKLDRDYYDANELEKHIAQHLEEYTNEHGDTVEQVSFDVEEEMARLKMKYDSCEAYTGFNGIELYVGTIVQARAEGYDFDAEFYSVEDAEKKEQAGQEEIFSKDDNKVAIIRANVNVRVPGKILYVSAQDTELEGKDTVSITGAGANEEAAYTYIIYE